MAMRFQSVMRLRPFRQNWWKTSAKPRSPHRFTAPWKKKANLYPGHAVQWVSAISATEKIAEYLRIRRGDALLHLIQLSYLQDGRPFEYVHTQYVGSRFEFVLEK